MSLTEKRIEWKARYNAWKSGDQSIAEWCRKQGIKVHQMYYWIQKFEHPLDCAKEGTTTPWLAVKVDNNNIDVIDKQEPIFIHFGTITVEVRSGADTTVLSNVVKVLQNQ